MSSFDVPDHPQPKRELARLQAMQEYDEHGNPMIDTGQKKLRRDDTRVSLIGAVGNRGELSFDEYVEAVTEQIRRTWNLTDLPAQDNPVARYEEIVAVYGEIRPNGDLVFVVDTFLELTISAKDIMSTANGDLVHKDKVAADRRQHKHYQAFSLKQHLDHLRKQIVELTNGSIQAADDRQARTHLLLSKLVRNEDTGVATHFRYCGGFDVLLSELWVFQSNTMISTRGDVSMLQYLAMQLVRKVELPSHDDPYDRFEAMSAMEAEVNGVNMIHLGHGVHVPRERVGFRVLEIEYELVLNEFEFSWQRHMEWMLDLFVQHEVGGIEEMSPKEQRGHDEVRHAQREHDRQQPQRPVRRGPRMDPTTPGLSRQDRSAAYAASQR